MSSLQVDKPMCFTTEGGLVRTPDSSFSCALLFVVAISVLAVSSGTSAASFVLAGSSHSPAERATESGRSFSFEQYLFGDPVTLSIWVQELNEETGYVVVNGVDMSGPPVPFVWGWGDGVVESGWFPGTHTYTDTSTNYVCTVRADYAPGDSDSVRVVVRFTAPDVTPVALPDETSVSVPDTLVALISRMPGYGIPALTPFGDEFFTVMPRWIVEYALSVGAGMQNDMVNGDVFLVDGGFRQVILRDALFAGMYSLWYTSPVSFGAGDYAFGGSIQWSSFLHEMGHNATLNFPADYYYGGKIDGNANAIYSETMAQIFQYATAYELMNNGGAYGLPDNLLAEIWISSTSAISGLRNAYDRYVAEGMHFASWNDPGTPEDETMDTFATLAYKFCAHAETQGSGYLAPLQRMTWLLAVFDEDLELRYDRHNNTAVADTFRATLMVTALSFAFDEDLRQEFRDLGFPVGDAAYDELMGMAVGIDESDDVDVQGRVSVTCRPNPFNPCTIVSYRAGDAGVVSVRVFDTSGREVRTLVDCERAPGVYEVAWDGTDSGGNLVASGVYLVRVSAGGSVGEAKAVLLK